LFSLHKLRFSCSRMSARVTAVGGDVDIVDVARGE
jgi:hypothetical protein